MDFLNEFLTWDILGSPYGWVFITCVLVEFLKKLIDKSSFLKSLGTFTYAVPIALGVRIIYLIGINDLGFQPIALAFFNSFLVEVVAGKLVFDLLVKPLQNKFQHYFDAVK
ncbi:MAG: hypothetical protein WDA59_08865 [Methanofastidiosum sp.]